MGARQYVGDAHLQAGAAQLLELQQQVVRLLVSHILHRFKVKRVKDSRATEAVDVSPKRGRYRHKTWGRAQNAARSDQSAVVDMYCVYSSPSNMLAAATPTARIQHRPPRASLRLRQGEPEIAAAAIISERLKLKPSVCLSQHICYG